MSRKSPKRKVINRIAIDELRRTYDALNASSDQLTVKTLTFTGAGFAIMTYLYSGQDLFIPVELYGKIFYFGGLASVIAAIILLLLSLRPYPWRITTELKQLKDIRAQNEGEYLEYVKDQYIEAYEKNVAGHERRHTAVHLGFILLIAGAFVLIVLKNFPGHANPCYTKLSTACAVVQPKKE